MAQTTISVSTQHGSTIDVPKMASDGCVGFATTVYLKVPNSDIPPYIYAMDTVYLVGDNAALRLLLEKCLAALDAREAAKEVLHAV